jgi:hypothetical protein
MSQSHAPRFFILTPQATGRTSANTLGKQLAVYLDASGTEMLWSAPFALPAIGQRIYVTMNGLGWAKVRGYFTEHGNDAWYLGVMTELEKPPAWLRRQRKERMNDKLPQWAKDGIGCEYGAEIALTKPRQPRVKKVVAAAAMLLLSLFWLAPVQAQSALDCMDDAMRLVVPGLGGGPDLVSDEVPCRWFAPIPVYAEPDIQLFITSYVATEGWATWFANRKEQQFTVTLYSYYPNSKECVAQLGRQHMENDPDLLKGCTWLRYQQRRILIDLKAGTVTVLSSYLVGPAGRAAFVRYKNEPKLPFTYPLDGAIPPGGGEDKRGVYLLRQAVARIVPVLKRQLEVYP